MQQLGLYGRSTDAVLQAVAQGATALGWVPVFRRDGVFTPDCCGAFDAVVVRGFRGHGGTIRDAYHARGVPVLVLDLPKLRTQCGAHYLGLNTLHWLPGDPLPEDRLAAIHLPEPLEVPGADVLVLGQKPDDAAHGMSEAALLAWGTELAAALRSRTPRELVWRAHPLAGSLRPAGYDRYANPAAPLLDSLVRAAWVVTYNSTSAVDAALVGRPVVVLDPNAFAAPIATVGLPEADPDPVSTELRRAFLSRLAYTQWSLDELLTSYPLRFTLLGERPARIADSLTVVAPPARSRRARKAAA